MFHMITFMKIRKGTMKPQRVSHLTTEAQSTRFRWMQLWALGSQDILIE